MPTAEVAPRPPTQFTGRRRLPSADPHLDDAKRRARVLARAHRDRVHKSTGDGGAMAARALSEHVLVALAPELVRPRRISAYWAIGSEIDPIPLLTELLARGHQGGLPVVVGRNQPLVFQSWQPGQALQPGTMGIPIPVTDVPILTPDLLLVPLLAFDRRGYRLGYGGGFYDRTLAALRATGAALSAALAVGVGFAEQEVPEVPHGSADRRLDWIATERSAWPVAVAGTA